MLGNESTAIMGIKLTLAVDNSSRWSRCPSKWGDVEGGREKHESLKRVRKTHDSANLHKAGVIRTSTGHVGF